MKTHFKRILWGTLGLILFSFPAIAQTQPQSSPFSALADSSTINSGITSEGQHIQPYELDPESLSIFLSYPVQETVVPTALPLHSLHNPAKLLEYAEAAHLDYFSRPPPSPVTS